MGELDKSTRTDNFIEHLEAKLAAVDRCLDEMRCVVMQGSPPVSGREPELV
jgi:hypothetical protein